METAQAAESPVALAAPPAGPLLAIEAADAGVDAVGERLCIICLSDPVETMLLPCRHAVLCRGCTREVREGSGRGVCPLCRAAVNGVVEGRFAEDFVRMLTAAERRLDWAQVSLYEGMYNHVRLCMSFGACAGLAATAVFISLPLPLALVPGSALAAVAFTVGYIPWFLTTAAAFERQDEAVRERPSLLNFFSSEDLKQPLVVVTKAVTVTVGMPLAVAGFFAPYFCYKAIVRPLARIMQIVILHGTCYVFAYIVLPTSRGIAWSLEQVVRAACWAGGVLWQGVTALAGFTRDYLVLPLCDGVAFVCQAMYDNVLVPVGDGLAFGTRCVWDNVFVPVGRGAWALLQVLAGTVQSVGAAFGSYLLAPLCDGICWVARRIGRGLSFCATVFYAWVVVPTGQGLTLAVKGVANLLYYTFKGAFFVLRGTYDYVLVPLGAVAVDVATKLYAMVLVPTWRALAGTAGAIYEFVLLPVGRATAHVAGAVAATTRAVFGAVAAGLAAGASAVYEYVFVPVGSMVSALAGAVSTHIIHPTMEATGYVASAMAEASCQAVTAAHNTFTDAVGAFTQTADHCMQQVRAAF